MSDDDDWFERALRESDAPDEADAESEGADPDAPESEDAESEGADPDESATERSEADEESRPGPGRFESLGDEGDEDDSPFDEDFASAFQNAPNPSGPPGEESGVDDFGGGFGGEGGFGGDDFDDEG
ncbi:MAG: KaiC domain-containing protein, partial [Haloplanus sp.]